MIDFLIISTRSTKRGVIEIYPKFIIKKSSDLMIRGGDFYAIWLEDRGLWSTDEQDALQLIDWELDKYAEENRKNFDSSIKVLHMWDSESGMIDSWHKYCQKQMRDSFHMLDEKLIFSNTPTNKKDYASKRLNYPLEEGATDAWNKLMSTIYSEEERTKIEWAIGSIVCGESKKLQKFMVLYGAAGTGKSTVLNIVQQLFEGWVLINDEPKEGTILIEMPYPYIIEMICDWWAFSWIKGDLSEMFAWYKDHESYIKLHNNTRSIVEEILEMIRTKLTEVENAEN